MTHFVSRSRTVALTSAALIGLSGIALPAVANAADATCSPEDATYSVTGGTIEWGFKQSFRSYFFGNFAHGVFTPSEGVSFAGDEKGTDGRVVWPVTAGTVGSTTAATASGAGGANFTAHGGAMDTTLSNPTVEINGTEGILKLDYAGNEFDMSGGTPVPIGGTQVVAATFDLTAAPDFHAGGTTSLNSGPSIIGDDFVPAFNNYPSGSELDPVSVNLTVTASCEDAGEPGDGDDNGDGGDNGGGDDNGTLPGDGDDNDDDNNGGGGGIFGSLGSLGKLFDFLPF